MSLHITERDREGVTILDLAGRMVMGQETAKFRAEVERIVLGSEPKLILNLKAVDYIDSTGLGALVLCATSLKKSGGAVRLIHLNRRHVELLVITKIDTIFEVFEDETDAVNSFFPGREARRFDIMSFIRDEPGE